MEAGGVSARPEVGWLHSPLVEMAGNQEASLTAQDVERIAREFIQVWSVGNLDVLDRLASEDLEVAYAHFPEAIVGRRAFRSALEETFMHFPDLKTTARTIIADGERAAVEWRYEGTHRHGDLFGIQPSGRRVRVSGTTFYRVRDGRVVEERGVVDVLGLMQQLGAFGQA